MKDIFSTRKGIFLFAQILAILLIVLVVFLFQIGAFAGPNQANPKTPSAPTGVTPTMLSVTKAQETGAPIEAPPESSDGPVTGNEKFANSPGMIACQTQVKAGMDEMFALNAQASQIMGQVNELRSTASATTDAVEAGNINAQAEALEVEVRRIEERSSQLHQQLFQGHSGFSCTENGISYTG
jgi:hypothetical protein